VDGQHLLVSRDAGPAVIGFRVPAVVIPEWVLELDAALRALVLRHEREHLEGGDPKLLLGAVTAATLAPWNPVAWFQLHRLRSAMELDCDHRVLRAHPDARRYGSLLLAVAQRGDRSDLLAAALTESKSLLARRIAAMRRPVVSFRLTQTALLATSAILATIVACEMQAPSPTQPKVAIRGAAPTVANGPYFEFQVEKPVKPASGGAFPRYPDELRKAGVGGEVLAQFIVGPDGRADVESFKVLKSTHELFTKSVRAALPQMRFEPALVGGRAVHQLVQQPFTFSLTK
jgi:TonB family protein